MEWRPTTIISIDFFNALKISITTLMLLFYPFWSWHTYLSWCSYYIIFNFVMALCRSRFLTSRLFTSYRINSILSLIIIIFSWIIIICITISRRTSNYATITWRCSNYYIISSRISYNTAIASWISKCTITAGRISWYISILTCWVSDLIWTRTLW